MKDRDTKTIKVRTVTSECVNDYAVRRLVKAIGELGHKKVILKSDGESAIVALKQRVKHNRQMARLKWPISRSKASFGL